MQTIKNTVGFTLAMALVTWPMITDMLFGTHLTVGYVIILLTVGYLKKRCQFQYLLTISPRGQLEKEKGEKQW